MGKNLTNEINQEGSKKIRHNGNTCCSFCKTNKTIQQNLRRFIYGRNGREVIKRIKKPIISKHIEPEIVNDSMEWDWARKL